MIIGSGIDLVEIERVRRVYHRWRDRFMSRIFTEGEKQYIQARRGSPYPSMAARYAAKEAALKALGCGIGPALMREVEVVSGNGGAPNLRLHGNAAQVARDKGVSEIKLSLTHEAGLACASAIAIGESKTKVNI